MDALTTDKARGTSADSTETRARIGLIIPAVNTLSEPQFNRFAPAALGVHVTRARVSGEWKRPLTEMGGEIAMAAKLLSDCEPNLIVFHCTDTSMTEAPDGEGRNPRHHPRCDGNRRSRNQSTSARGASSVGAEETSRAEFRTKATRMSSAICEPTDLLSSMTWRSGSTRSTSARSRRNSGSCSRGNTTTSMPKAFS